MPVYNCRSYIQEAVNSILHQTFRDFEFIIIDDNSTDGTLNYLESLTDKRIILIKKPQNSGYTISLNMGLKISRGAYITRMDGDDISVPHRFQRQWEFMEAKPNVILCGSGYQVINSSKRWTPPVTTHNDILVALLETCPFAHPTVIFRSNIIKENNITYNHLYEPAEDYKMWTVLQKYGELANIEQVLLHYREHLHQTTVTRSDEQKKISRLIRKELTVELCEADEMFGGQLIFKIDKAEDLITFFKNEYSLQIGFNKRGIVLDEHYYEIRLNKILEESLRTKTCPLFLILKLLPVINEYKKSFHLLFFIKHFIKRVIRRG